MKFAASDFRGACWCLILSCAAMLLLFFVSSSPAGEARSPDEALRQLAERVAAIPNFHGPVRIKFDGEGNFARETAAEWKDTFVAALEKHRISATKDESAPILCLAVVETPAQLVFTAAIHVGERDEVRMICLARTALHVESEPLAQMRVEKQFLYESSERILDAAPASRGSDGGIIILGYRDAQPVLTRLDAGGKTKQMITLSAANSRLSRDPHGELSLSERGGEVFLNGKSCEFSWSDADNVKCRSAKADLSEAVVLAPTCQSGDWKLEADGRDWSAPEMLQIVPDGAIEGQAVLVSEFPGPILKIHGAENQDSALIVAKNLRTGNYGVYQITLACGN